MSINSSSRSKQLNDYYHPIAQDYAHYGDAAVTDWYLGLFNVYKYLVTSTENLKGKTLLDYGCGTGKFCRFLKDKGATVIGADVSKDMLKIAAETSSSMAIEYHLIQSGCLDFIPSNSIDYVTMNFVLCILDNEPDMQKILNELQRVLKPNGKLVMLSVNWEQAKNREFISFKPEPIELLKAGQCLYVTLKGNPPIRVEEHFWPIKHYCHLLEQAGLTLETIEEPTIPLDNKKHAWIDEHYYAPFFIMVGIKS